MSDVGDAWVYVASYTDENAMKADHVAVRQLHANGAFGSYDVVELHRDADGKLRISKDESSTRHGAWGGLVGGALVGLLFPPAIIGTAAIGAGLGAIGGHLEGGLDRADVKRLAAAIEDDHWGLVVVAHGKLDEVAPQAFSRAAGYQQGSLTGLDHDAIEQAVADTVREGGAD